MIFGSIRAYSGWLAWVGLANWLPFFWVFWGFQPYLLTTQARRKCALSLLSGSLPVLVTGFGQLWFGWEGPWQLFGGLIIWFMSPGGEPLGRLSGLFDYANIAGAWLAIVWPFALAALLQPSLNRFRRFFLFRFRWCPGLEVLGRFPQLAGLIDHKIVVVIAHPQVEFGIELVVPLLEPADQLPKTG